MQNMTLKWRNAEYLFRAGEYMAKPDGEKTADYDAPFIAIDTETFTADAGRGRCEPLCYQVSGADGEWMEYLPPGDVAIETLLCALERRYRATLQSSSVMFCWCHNLLFDFGQLVKQRPDLMVILRTGIGIDSPLKICDTQGCSIWMRKGGLFEGNSPFFEIEYRWSKRNKARIKFRDTYSYFPASLDRLGKTLGLPALKLDRPEELGSVDYRLLHPTDQRRVAFEAYALRDPLTTRLVAEQIRNLHSDVGIKKIRVSAPSYAIAYLLHTTPRDTKFVTGVHDETIMQLVVDSYSGGRTGGVLHGAVSDVTVYDIHSSYPASMTTLPSFGTSMEYVRIDPAEFPDDDLLELMDTVPCFLRASGCETDTRYPALIQNIDGALTPVSGRFYNVPTTGIEMAVGIKSGTVVEWSVSEMVILIDNDQNAIFPFRDFAVNAYTRKQNAEKNSPDYTSAKLVLNSSYGKLIESRSETHICSDDEGIIVPIDSRERLQWSQNYFADYVNAQLENPGCDYYERIKGDLMAIAESIPETYLEWASLGALNLQKLEYGRYAIPAAAALITATSRARLRTAMRAFRAVYWDTDSVFVESAPDIEHAQRLLANESAFLPQYAQPVTIGDNLGDLGAEIEHARGYLAGVKRYWLSDGTETKSAIHGMAGLRWEQRETALKQLATGSGLSYESKPRPVTPKSAADPDRLGRFESRTYQPAFRLDPRLDWHWNGSAYTGRVREWTDLSFKKPAGLDELEAEDE